MRSFLKEIAALWKPHPGQREFLLAKPPFRILACGRRWGKTDVCAVQVAHRLHRGPPSTTLLVAPTLDQARILFERVLDLLFSLHESLPDQFPMPKIRQAPYPRLELDGRKVFARSAHRPRSLRGLGVDHLIADEAAYLPRGVLGDVLLPMLATAEKGTTTLLSTPSGFGEFQRFFERGQAGGNAFWSRTAPSTENPRVSKSYLEMMRSSIPEATFAREYEGRFAGVEHGVFAFEAVREAVGTDPLQWQTGPFLAGLDVARTRDWTALVIVSGIKTDVQTVFVDRWRGVGWERQLRRVQEILERFPGVRLWIDGTGMGDPVVAWAKQLMPGMPIQAFQFRPDTKRQLIGNLASLFETKAIRIPDHSALIDELLSFVEKPNGKIEGLGEHDDLVCALALATLDLPLVETRRIDISGSLLR